MHRKIFLAGALLVSTILTGFDSKASVIGEQSRYISCSKVIYAEPYKPEYSKEDIELLALVTGKRLVIDTVLNRVDHGRFPDTISDVIYQKGQFSSMWNGRSNRCYVSDDICKLVEEELESRTNTDVIFFHAGRYSDYGSPLFQVGNHYFSSYN